MVMVAVARRSEKGGSWEFRPASFCLLLLTLQRTGMAGRPKRKEDLRFITSLGEARSCSRHDGQRRARSSVVGFSAKPIQRCASRSPQLSGPAVTDTVGLAHGPS